MPDKNQKPVSSLTGSDRDNLLNTNAEIALKNMGYGDVYPHMVEASRQTNGRIQPWETFETISRESKFNPKAQSTSSSAGGWGQFIDSTAKENHLLDKFNPVESVYAITRYLNQAKKEGAISSEDDQEAYMLGPNGWKRMTQGKYVAGIEDIPKLRNKFKSDLDKLLSGSVSAESWQGNNDSGRSKAAPPLIGASYDKPQLIETVTGKKGNTMFTANPEGALSSLMKSDSNVPTRLVQVRDWQASQRNGLYDKDYDDEISALGAV